LIELPHNPNDPTDQTLRQFDYNTISDVIIHVKYSAREDAGPFKQKAVDHFTQLVENTLGDNPIPLKRMLNAQMEFPTPWYRFLHKDDPPSDNVLELEISKDRFPFFTRHKDIKINTVHLLVLADNTDEYKVQLSPPLGTDTADLITLAPPPVNFGNLHYGFKDVSSETMDLVDDPANPWKLKIRKSSVNNFHSISETEIKEIYIIFEYNLE
jgi:hypothetical protein